jgi:quercetin dioxygenase-like cupin family protein
MYVHDNRTKTGGFVMAADEGQAFWFLNTLTINKVRSDDTQGQLSIVDHRVPAGFAPPPHIHQASDEAFLVLDGEFEGFCGDQTWRARPGSLVYLPHGIPRTASPCPRPVLAGSSWSCHQADSTNS